MALEIIYHRRATKELKRLPSAEQLRIVERVEAYAAGRTDHTIDGGDLIEHIVGLVEQKVAMLQAEQAAAQHAAE